MEIHTKRLFIRPFLDHDEEIMLRLLTDSKIKETYMIPDFDCMEKVLRLFKRYQELSKTPERIVGAITLDDHVIGFFNDTGIRDGYIELGYVIDPAFHNQGYMTEDGPYCLSFRTRSPGSWSRCLCGKPSKFACYGEIRYGASRKRG